MLNTILAVLAAVLVPWQNPSVNEINRYPMHTTFDAAEQRLSLHGVWDFRFNDGEWTTMPVPGMWELNGCGDPVYVNIGYAWRGHAENTPGRAPMEHNYSGLYRKSVTIPADWKGKDIFITIGSATSCISVSVDGRFVGYSEDSKLAADFDKSTGALCSYRLGGRELMAEPLMPCFGRAVTENDLGASLQEKMKFWLYPEFTLTDFIRERDYAKAVYSLSGKATVEVVYEIDSDGSIKVKETMKVMDRLPDLFRFGMEMAMPHEYETIEFYGLGPNENYSDRQSSAMVGLYRQKVSRQYHYGYVRPQESGTHCGLRWLDVVDDAGYGLRFSVPASSDGFSASALPFGRRDIDLSVTGRGSQSHSLELKPDGKTHLNIDLVQMGLGCINAWGAVPRDEYMIPARDCSFEFTISPTSCPSLF